VIEIMAMPGCSLSRGAGDLALPAHDVEHARRQHVGGQLGQTQHRVGGEFGGLEHHGVACGQCRPELPGRHVERIVPRGDRGDHAERVAAHHRGVSGHVLTGGLAFEEPAGRGEEPPVVLGEVHLELDDPDRLADVLAFDP
jgi:hypothetical protein